MTSIEMPKEIFCSFCGCAERETDFFVEGDNAFICDNCIDKAREFFPEIIAA